MRTAELSDSDPTNNRNHYYLSDVMGGNMGLYMDEDGDPGTEREAVFQQFDAFGNDMSKPLSWTSSFAWRGQEGSVTDRASRLIYMQARHYDPSIGRFIQADALALASLTTQGMNRYIYCENDPVNKSDPAGYDVSHLIGFVAIIGMVVAGIGLIATGAVLGGAAMIAWAFALYFDMAAQMETDCRIKARLLALAKIAKGLALSLALFQLGGFAGGMLAARTMGAALPAVGVKHAFFGLLGGVLGYVEAVASTEY